MRWRPRQTATLTWVGLALSCEESNWGSREQQAVPASGIARIGRSSVLAKEVVWLFGVLLLRTGFLMFGQSRRGLNSWT